MRKAFIALLTIATLTTIPAYAKSVDIDGCEVTSIGDGRASYNCVLDGGAGRITIIADASTPDSQVDLLIEQKAVAWAQSVKEQDITNKKKTYKTKKWKVNF